MDKGVTCDHLNQLVEVLGEELWHPTEAQECFDCGCPGPNLWVCLQPECHHIGCSEVKNDHSTIHHRNYPSHCVHMNISTERIWCYGCEKEVHLQAALSCNRRSPEPASLGGSSASRLGFEYPVAMNISVADEDDSAEDIDDDDDRPKGLVGLQNMGNTCYMNAALQALSNTAPLTHYFLDCAAAVAVLAADKKPGLSRSYQKLIKEIWNKKTRGSVVPNGILYGIRNVHPMFRGYHQHDTQEFLRCFMDQLHEELKEPVYEDTAQDKMRSEDGDHSTEGNVHVRRRAASSGASDAPLFARMRRKSPAPSTYSEPRSDGYLRVHSASEGSAAPRHRRSASFAGTQHNAAHVRHDSLQRDVGSESELSCSSETEDRYETCSSGTSDVPDTHDTRQSVSDGFEGAGGVRHRSVVSDVFDGKLLSSVQCLICDRVSTRVETFQDLSLPIPSREHLAVLRAQQPPRHVTSDSWLSMWWLLGWLKSWFYGPLVSLQDCLAAFFSADELKGDNMYSCSRCNKLRNGVKTSGVVRLPEVLCVHLKRFRHELMFSSKVGAKVSFPIHDLNMAPYTHKECTSKIRRYSLAAVICHSGTAAGGHYTCVARNRRAWYEFDDQCVTPLHTHARIESDAYVLFYRKVNPQMTVLRQKAAELMQNTQVDGNDIKFYVSRQWINKFNTWAEPGPIDNSDFCCRHGGVRPDRVRHVSAMAAVLPQPMWEFLYDHFGGGPACSHVHACGECARAAQRLRARRERELAAFYDLHARFQEQERPRAVYAISMHWFRQWQAFVRNKTPQPPPPVDNTGIVTKQEVDGVSTYVLKQGSDHAQLSVELWRFFTDIYRGGPTVRLKCPEQPPQAQPQVMAQPHRSTSETDVREPPRYEPLHKNNSAQNISRRRAKPWDSDSDNPRAHRASNGNCDDDEMDNNNTTHLDNGVDDDNRHSKQAASDIELPNMESISLKPKEKSGKVRRMKRRPVK